MHRLPRNIDKRQQWIANINRNNLDLSKDWFICEVFIYCVVEQKNLLINDINIIYNIRHIFHRKCGKDHESMERKN